jgi:hypothetical protein
MAQVQWERGCGVAANASRIDTAETGAGHAMAHQMAVAESSTSPQPRHEGLHAPALC